MKALRFYWSKFGLNKTDHLSWSPPPARAVSPSQDGNYLLRSDVLQAISVPLAALCVAAILATAGWLCYRLGWAAYHGLRWLPAQRRMVFFTSVSLALEGVNAALWLANFAYTWAKDCSWFDKPGAAGRRRRSTM